jgi:hypothetical protein
MLGLILQYDRGVPDIHNDCKLIRVSSQTFEPTWFAAKTVAVILEIVTFQFALKNNIHSLVNDIADIMSITACICCITFNSIFGVVAGYDGTNWLVIASQWAML